MRWLTALITLFVLAVPVYGAVSDISIILASQNPYPVEPGETVDIEIQVQNNGYRSAENVFVVIDVSDPFVLVAGEDTVKSFNSISPMGSVTATYKLRVKDNTVSGDYDLKFKIYMGSMTGVYKTETVTISVRGEPRLILTGIDTIPANIEPGRTIQILPKIKNIGTGAAKNVQFILTSDTDVIVPVLSGGTAYIGDMLPGEEKSFELVVNIDTSAEYKTYQATLQAVYKDESNTDREESFIIGIPVTGKVLIELINTEIDLERNLVKFEIANVGTADAKSIESTLVIGNKTVGVDYVSQLKASKKTTLSFPLVERGSGELTIEYIGPGLERASVTKTVVISYQSGKGSDITAVIVVIVAVVCVYILWKKFGKKRK
ncbi:MAG: hypothetical protein DRP15_01700 [Candidatus Aenigmatarchaeota archaeon]|nr:MAG: hypothetical protein DRP15_01700 [Candidatus Aenigmarchaeota archaeon]